MFHVTFHSRLVLTSSLAAQDSDRAVSFCRFWRPDIYNISRPPSSLYMGPPFSNYYTRNSFTRGGTRGGGGGWHLPLSAGGRLKSLFGCMLRPRAQRALWMHPSWPPPDPYAGRAGAKRDAK
nr:hypothetical protein [Morchella crassipes]